MNGFDMQSIGVLSSNGLRLVVSGTVVHWDILYYRLYLQLRFPFHDTMLGFYIKLHWVFRIINFIGVHCGVRMVRVTSNIGEMPIVEETLGEALRVHVLFLRTKINKRRIRYTSFPKFRIWMIVVTKVSTITIGTNVFMVDI